MKKTSQKTIKNLSKYLALIIIGVFTIWVSPTFNHPLFTDQSEERVFKGVIQSIEEQATEENTTQNIKIKLTTPPEEGKIVFAKNEQDRYVQQLSFEKNETVIIEEFTSPEGEVTYIIQGHERYTGLFILFAIFVLAVLLVAGWQGAGSILGLIFSFLILFKFILPQILSGASPITTVIIGAFFIIPTNFLLSHGINRKTIIAMIGTFLTLIISGLIATYFAELTHLTGLASEETNFLKLSTQSTINFKGLVLSGILISILGILDDITVSQCSVIQQLKNTKPSITPKELFHRGMQVGHDHISSLVNTLILVYAGASLPMLLLFFDSSTTFHKVLNAEFMAEEIIQTLIGSIGLILAVPITTVIAAFFIKKNNEKTPIEHCH